MLTRVHGFNCLGHSQTENGSLVFRVERRQSAFAALPSLDLPSLALP